MASNRVGSADDSGGPDEGLEEESEEEEAPVCGVEDYLRAIFRLWRVRLVGFRGFSVPGCSFQFRTILFDVLGPSVSRATHIWNTPEPYSSSRHSIIPSTKAPKGAQTMCTCNHLYVHAFSLHSYTLSCVLPAHGQTCMAL